MSQPFLFISKHREHLVCCVSGKRGIIILKDIKHQILSFGTTIYKRILLLENYVWGKIMNKTLKKKKKKSAFLISNKSRNILQKGNGTPTKQVQVSIKIIIIQYLLRYQVLFT